MMPPPDSSSPVTESDLNKFKPNVEGNHMTGFPSNSGSSPPSHGISGNSPVRPGGTGSGTSGQFMRATPNVDYYGPVESQFDKFDSFNNIRTPGPH